MGSDRQRPQYEGILVMDRRVTGIDAANTTATEDAPQAGPITADAGFSTEAVIVATGTPENGDALQILSMRAGTPGLGGAGFAHRQSPATEWFGWDVPSKITGFEFVEDAVLGVGYTHPHCLTLPDGQVLILAGEDTTTLRGVSRRIRSTAGTYSASTTLYQETANNFGDHLHPQAVLLPSGRVLVYHAVMDDENDEVQIRMMYTDDATDAAYTLGANNVLADPFQLDRDGTHGATAPNGKFDGFRVAHSPDSGQFLLTIAVDPNNLVQLPHGSRIFQYASRNGVDFAPVGWNGTDDLYDDHLLPPAVYDHEVADFLVFPGAGAHDLVYSNGFFVIAYTSPLPGGGAIRFRRVGSAFAPLRDAPDVIPANAVGDGTETSLVVADDGTLFCYARPDVPGFSISTDTGQSWTTGISAGVVWGGLDVDAVSHSACWLRGQVYMAMNQGAPAANVLSLTAARLGGYSNLTLPPERITRRIARQSWWGVGWVGHDAIGVGAVPAATAFMDVSTGGAPTETRNTDGSWSVVAGALVIAIYENDATEGAAYIDIAATCRVRRNLGMWKLAIKGSESTTGQSTEAEIRVDANIAMFDTNGAQIGATVVGGGGSKIDLFLALKGRSATAWYSVVDDGDHRRQWIKIGTTATLTEIANTGDRIQLIGANSSNNDLWFAFAHRDGESITLGASTTIGQSMADDFANPGDLYARSLPSLGTSYVNDDVSIRGIDGPLLRGTEFSLELVHPSPVESIFPFEKASPRQVYQSASAAADQEIAFSLTGQAEEAHAGNDVIGVYIGNSNAQNVRLEGRNAAGAYSVITDISRAETGLAYIRSGNTVYPDEFGATVVGEYYARDELAGSYFVVSVGSGDTRTIIGNTEGHWSRGSSVAEKRCVIYLDDAEMDGTELTAGLTGAIVHRDTITYVHLRGNNTFRGYKLTLNDSAVSAVDAPPGGKFRVGVAVVGPIAVFGKRQDAEYSVARSAQVETEELTDGTMRTRILAPSRRTVVVNFGDGTDVTTARGPADPDYVSGTTSSGAEPIAHNRDVPLMIDGLLDELDGASSLVVYCPNIPAGAGSSSAPDVVTLRAGRAGGAVYGRIVGVVTQSAVVGDPMISEVLTGGSLTIREEV